MKEIFNGFELKKTYESLSPIDNIGKSPTIKMLKEAIKDKRNNNIALTGKYGAGKSSILKSYLKEIFNRKNKVLHISLGMFGFSNSGEISGTNDDGKKPLSIFSSLKSVDNFCKEIEKSIVQQIVYKEKYNKLEETRFKRAAKPNGKQFVFLYLFFCILIYSCLIKLLGEDIVQIVRSFMILIKYNGLTGFFEMLLRYVLSVENRSIMVIVLIASSIITFFNTMLSKWILRSINQMSIKSLNLGVGQTNVVLERNNGSLINQYMDELIYFFSKTKYELIVIEDLDRFLDSKIIKDRVLLIFQKLKELNTVLNNSNDIGRRIVFLYVVRDDMFETDIERTKFFDFIVPVMPTVTNYNSYNTLKHKKLEGVSDEALRKLAYYVSDFRLIKNICNEYELYYQENSKNIGNSLIPDKLFGMIILKNVMPKKYDELLNERGEIYDFIHSKHKYISQLQAENNTTIKENMTKIQELEKEKINDLNELKAIALGNLFDKAIHTYSSGESLKPEEFLKEKIDITYIEKNVINIRNRNGYYHWEEDVFQHFNGKDKFLLRAKNILDKTCNKVEILKNKNKLLLKECEELEQISLSEIIKNKNIINNNMEELVETLLANGYIDENYKMYMIKVEASPSDIYIANVIQGKKLQYDFYIDNPKMVIESIENIYFNRKEILNYNILEELVNSKDKSSIDKKERFIAILLTLDAEAQEFIFSFMNRTTKADKFLLALINKKQDILYDLFIANKDVPQRLHVLIKNALECKETLSNSKFLSEVKSYLENEENIDAWLRLEKDIETNLKQIDVKFANFNEQIPKEWVYFVANNNLYKPNFKMLKIILDYNSIAEYEFSNKNLSLVNKDKAVKDYVYANMDYYINNCYILTTQKDDPEELIIDCINNYKLPKQTISKIIENRGGKFKRINEINSKYYDELLILDKVEPKWSNYCYLYSNNNNVVTKTLQENILLHLNELENEYMNLNIENESEATIKRLAESIVRDLIANSDVNLEYCEKLASSYNIIIDKIQDKNLTKEKIMNVVENKRVKFSLDNFLEIQKQSVESIERYVVDNINEFRNNIGNIDFTKETLEVILLSTKIKFSLKTKILKSVNVDIVSDKILKYIVNNYARNRISSIPMELKEKILNSSLKIETKIDFLNKEMNNDELQEEKLKKYIDILPSPYKDLGKGKQPKRVSIDRTTETEKFVTRLEVEIGGFTKKIYTKKIVVYNKK